MIYAVDLDGAEAAYRQPDGTFSEPSDALRHPIPKGAYMPSIAGAPGMKETGKRMAIGAGVVALSVVASPYVAAAARTLGVWAMGAGATVASNPQLVSEAGNFAVGLLDPGPGEVNPGSSSDELGKMARQALKKVPRVAKQLLGTKAQVKNIPELSVWEGDDAARYLKGAGKAAYMAMEEGKGLLILGKNPTVQEIAEEVLHHEQHLKYGMEYFTANRTKLEVEAQDILLKMGKDEGWSKEAMEEIGRARARARASWVEKLNKEKK